MNLADDVLVRILMRLPPETAHHTALSGLSFAAALPGVRALLRARYAPVADPVEVCGLRFPNRVGLAAGYDKDAAAVAGLDALGFGHLELGTVTLVAQAGNPGVRIVRLSEDQALVNRMGFPGRGVEPFVRRVQAARQRGLQAVIGANLGKNRTTPNERAPAEYAELVARVGPHVDYVCVNVSSPNTKDLRDLQRTQALAGLLAEVVRARDALDRHLPVFVKLAPDGTPGEAARAVEAAGCDAVVLGNTTIQRPIPTSAEGGLSGRPLGPIALRALDEVVAATALPVVAAGGISDGEDLRRRLDAGACLVQVYTALVFQGPAVLRRLERAGSGGNP